MRPRPAVTMWLSVEQRKEATSCALLLGGVVVVAVILRTIALGQESYFIDEVITAESLGRNTWAHVRDIETSPPLYFYLIRAWGAVCGNGHESLRMFSVLAGAAAAGLTAVAGWLMGFGRKRAALAGLLVSVAPMAVFHSQQARHYALLTATAAMYLVLLSLCVRCRARGWLALLAVGIFLGFSVHYYFAFVVLGAAPAVLALAIADRRPGILVAHAVGGLAGLVYLPLFRIQAARPNIDYIPRPTWRDLGLTFGETFVVGPFNQAHTWLVLAHGALTVAAVVLLVLAAVRARTSADAPPAWFWPAVLAGAALTPVVVPFAISLGVRPIFLRDRYPVVALPAYFLAFAFAAGVPKQRGGRLAAVALTLLLFLPAGFWGLSRYYRTFQDFDWRGAIRAIDGNWREGDRLLFLPGWMSSTYRINGGTHREFIRASEAANPEVHRIWLAVWEQNPSPEEQAVMKDLRSRPGATSHLVWPHMALWEIPTSQP